MIPPSQNIAAIVLACEGGHTEVVKLLLDDPRVDPFAKGSFGSYGQACICFC